MKFSLNRKTILLIVCIAAVISLLSVFIYDKGIGDVIKTQYEERSIEIARLVSLEIDSDKVLTVQKAVREIYDQADNRVMSDQWGSPKFEEYVSLFASVEKMEDYQAVLSDLRKMQDVLHVNCLYITWPDAENDCNVILVDAAYDNPCPVGCIDPIYIHGADAAEGLKNGFAPNVTNTPEYGWIVATGMPIHDGEGNPIAISAVDISMNGIMALHHRYLLYAVASFLLFTVLVAILGIYLVRRVIIKPINTLTQAAARYKDDREVFSKLKIARGDEIGILADTMTHMEEDINGYIHNLEETTSSLVEAREHAKEMDYAANIDALTKVRNKRAYEMETKRLNESAHPYCIVMIDLNELKAVNDTYGHEKGDISIYNTCQIICRIFAHSPVFRIGGDEFVVILENSDFDDRKALIQELRDTIRKNAQDESLPPWERATAAVGYAVYDPWMGGDVNSIQQRADAAMYENKKKMKAEAAAPAQPKAPDREKSDAGEALPLNTRRYVFGPEAQSALESIKEALGVYQVIDGRLNTLLVSDGFCRQFGYPDRKQAVWAMDHDLFSDIHPDDKKRVADATLTFANSADDDEYEVVYRIKSKVDSTYRMIHAYGKHLCPQPGYRIAQVFYMDESRYVEGEEASGADIGQGLSGLLHEDIILRAANTDLLTGLPNLSCFVRRCEYMRANYHDDTKPYCILYIDLNGMKYFNHRYGFAEGDRLLRSFADILAQTFGHEKSCHIGADRFAVAALAEGVEERLQYLFDAFDQVSNHLPVRVGIYSSNIENVPISSAYDRAKLACDNIRKSESSSFRYFTQELNETSKRSSYIQANIDRAIEEKWITVYYQAIVRAVNERVCDEEALARWIDPENGFLSPAEFIPILEESGQIYKLDLYVLEQVLEKTLYLKKQGMDVVPNSINLSRSDFEACDIVEEIRKRVDAAGVSRDLITVEITESIIGSNVEYMKSQVDRFRELGFKVWLDDFGSGYSSMEVLQRIRFDLVKFDMSFLQKIGEEENARIVLTELVKLVTSLGIDTVCEGVETRDQVRFLQEIGCSKLQGYYYSKPASFDSLMQRYVKEGLNIEFEDPSTSPYYEAIGRTNVFDLDMTGSPGESSLQSTFSTLPIGIVEIQGEPNARFLRSNPAFRQFVHRYFGMDLSSGEQLGFSFSSQTMQAIEKQCRQAGDTAFCSQKTRSGSMVHTFARCIGKNPQTGHVAVAIAVLSVSEPDESETYSDIARALASDYYNIYVIDLDTDQFIEYSSTVGKDELAMERHGERFFDEVLQAAHRIYAEDQDAFFAAFSKEQIIHALDTQGVYTATYRLVDTGSPMYVHMKVTRMQAGSSRIIMGISIIDSQMKQKEEAEKMQKERDVLARVMALSEDYLCLYSVDPATGSYREYSASDSYETFGFAKTGEDFFLQGALDGRAVVHPDDLPGYLERFTRKNVMAEIQKNNVFKMHYRLVIQGRETPVSLIIKPFIAGNENTLMAAVRAWRTRKS